MVFVSVISVPAAPPPIISAYRELRWWHLPARVAWQPLFQAAVKSPRVHLHAAANVSSRKAMSCSNFLVYENFHVALKVHMTPQIQVVFCSSENCSVSS